MSKDVFPFNPDASFPISRPVPTITENDLVQFHLLHFPQTALPHTSLSDASLEHEELYPDGAPRTLTDEQIAMFRHSEIQQLLKDLTSQLSSLEEINEASCTSALQNILQSRRSAKREAPDVTDQESEPSHTRPPPKRRKKRKTQSERRRLISTRHNPDDYKDGGSGITHRRKAREMDEQKSVEVDLDY